MNEISCEVCMDLIPLVRDGVASNDSIQAVEAHTASCAACRALCEGLPPPPAQPDSGTLLAKAQSKVRFFCALLMFLGISFGVSLTQNAGMFYNILIMPAIGAFGYGVYRWKSLWMVPLCVFLIHGLSQLLLIFHSGESWGFFGCLWWSVIMSAFADVGVLIAWLVHFAFRKEKNHEES